MRFPLPLAFALLAIALPRPAHALAISPDGKAATLNVMTYNVWGVPFAGKRAKQRLPRIAERLASSGVDIVALEEVFDGCFVSDETKTILRGSRYPYYALGPSRKGVMPCVNSGVMILSRFPIRASSQLVYRSCVGTDCLARKGAVYARIRVPSVGDVDVYATHTNAGDRHGAVRVRQARQLVDFVRAHSGDGQRPVVLMGDLNAIPGSEEIELLRKELGLRDVHEEFVAQNPVSPIEREGYTSDPLRNGNLHGGEEKRQRIDYVLIRESRTRHAPFRALDTRMTFQEPTYDRRALSDHFGVRSALLTPTLAGGGD